MPPRQNTWGEFIAFDAVRAQSIACGTPEASALKGWIEMALVEADEDRDRLEVANAFLTRKLVGANWTEHPLPGREVDWRGALNVSYRLGINAAYIFDKHTYAHESMMAAAWLGQLAKGWQVCLTAEIDEILDDVLPHVPELPDHAINALRLGRKAKKPVLVSNGRSAGTSAWVTSRAGGDRS